MDTETETEAETETDTDTETAPQPVHKSLTAAVVAVMKEIGYVYKSGQMKTGERFTYASDADLIRAIRPAMIRHGLVIIPGENVTHTTDQVKSSKGNPQYLDHVMAAYTLEHVDSGETRPIRMPGAGMDVREKGVYKGLTGAYKYALRQIFMIETGDDPERDAEPEDMASRIQELEQQLAKSREELDRLDTRVDEERRWVVRQHYTKPEEDAFDGRAFARVLKDAELPGLQEVRWFCLWLGRKKPSLMDDDQRGRLVKWLGSDVGRKRFQDFLNDCGIM